MLTLNRRTVLKTVAAAAALAILPGRVRAQLGAATQEAEDPLTPALTKLKVGIRRVSENFVVLLGAGGNIGVLETKDGVIVIDAGVPERSKDVAGAIALVAKGKPDVLINTHYHYDHVGGNEAVHGLGYKIAAHENVRKRLSAKSRIDFFDRVEEAAPEAARPTVTYADAMAFHPGGETVSLIHNPPAHTDGDTIIVLEKQGIVQTGDLFFNAMYPFIDYSAGGSLDGMIAAEEGILKRVDDKTKIVPGHGMVCGKAELQAEIDMLKKVRDAIKPLVYAGKTEAEVIATKPLAMFRGKYDKGFLNDDLFTKLVYKCYTWKAQ